MKKLLIIVLDGVGGLPIPELGGRTCLENASRIHLNSLARKSKFGYVYPINEEIAPESDAAVLSLLGYDVSRVYTGRGPLEALGAGVPFEDGNLALRANFATVDGKRIVDRRCGRNLAEGEARELADLLNSKLKIDEYNITVRNTIGHRAVVVFKGDNLTADVSNFDPAYSKTGNLAHAVNKAELFIEPVKALNRAGEETAALLNRFIEQEQEILKNADVNIKRRNSGMLEANILLFRDGGVGLPNIETIEKRFNIRMGALTEMPVERGIAKICGMVEFYTPLSEKNVENSLKEKAEIVLKSLPALDGMYIHLKGPDEPGHDGDCKKKIKKIEEIDQYFFGELLKDSTTLENAVIAVTADHSTPCIRKGHTPDPVPLMVYDSRNSSTIPEFSERICKKYGSVPVRYSRDLLQYLLNSAQ